MAGRKKVAAPTEGGAAQMGLVRRPLERPERAADMTVAETLELKERKRLIEAKVQEAQDLNKLIAILRIENETYMRKMLEGRGLPGTDDYNMDTDGGVIWRTATMVDVKPEVVDNEEDGEGAGPIEG